jgi:integrase/recombinase XerD
LDTQTAVDAYLTARSLELSAQSIALYRQQLGRFAGMFEDLPARPDQVEYFLMGIKGAKVTRYGYYRTLRAFYGFVKARYRVKDIMQGVSMDPPKKKLMATLEPEQQMRVLRAADRFRDRAMVTILVDTGIRVGELVGLGKGNVYDGFVMVDGKTAQRFVPVSEETMTALRALVATAGKNGYLFQGYKGRPMTRGSAYRIIRGLMEKAGVHGPKLGPHRIRHSFGKGYLVSGGDIRSLQLLMGHSQITTTEGYAALNLEDLTDKHHKFTPLRAAYAAAQMSFLKETDSGPERKIQ